ncbi:hypothetical protein PIROE2DRAFT_62732 [Piromyces sp. E2]|nr:hypothetical protein PIROE2DRAFT_62732 [Piromyces sp. E2]|eukprot:OUM61089.1 hypothetical protein PIROE2DRAFT_62732 [Piromyces sp. E2]
MNNTSNDSKMNINAKSFEPTTTTTTTIITTNKKIESTALQSTNHINHNTPQLQNFDTSISDLSTTSTTTTLYSNSSLPPYNTSNGISNGTSSSNELLPLPPPPPSSSIIDHHPLYDFDHSTLLNMEAYNTLIKNNNTNSHNNHSNVILSSLETSKYKYCASPSSSNNSHGQIVDSVNPLMDKHESSDPSQTETVKGQITEDPTHNNVMNNTIQNNHSNDFIYFNNSVQPTSNLMTNHNPSNNGMTLPIYYSSLNPLMNLGNNNINNNSNNNSRIGSQQPSSSSSQYSTLSIYSGMDSIDKSMPNTPNSLINSNSPCPGNGSTIPPSYRNEQDHLSFSTNPPNFMMGTHTTWIKPQSSFYPVNTTKMNSGGSGGGSGSGMNFNSSEKVNEGSTMLHKMKISNSFDDYLFSLLPQNLQNINKSNSINHPIISSQMKHTTQSEPMVEKEMNPFPLNYYRRINGSEDNHGPVPVPVPSHSNFLNSNLHGSDSFSTCENDDYFLFKEKDVDMERAKLFSAFANPKFHAMNDYLKNISGHGSGEGLNLPMNSRFNGKDPMTANSLNMNMLQTSFSNDNQYPKINNIISDFSTLSISNNKHPHSNQNNLISTEPSLTTSP